jgi:hypothetical protein
VVVAGLGLGLREQDLCGLLADLLHLGDDSDSGEAAAVGDPLLVETGLGLGKAAGDGLAGVVASPLPVGAVGLRRSAWQRQPGVRQVVCGRYDTSNAKSGGETASATARTAAAPATALEIARP